MFCLLSKLRDIWIINVRVYVHVLCVRVFVCIYQSKSYNRSIVITGAARSGEATAWGVNHFIPYGGVGVTI